MSIQDLDSRFPIVNPDGTATEYLLRLLRDRGSSQTETIEDLALKADKSIVLTAGTGLDGGGDLSANRTFDLNASINDLNDVDTATVAPTTGQGLVWDGTQWEPGTVSSSGGGGTAFSGALVKKAADQTAANYSAETAVAWDTEVYDTGGWHDNVTNNTRLTVPSGVTKVRVGALIVNDFVAANADTYVQIWKNGAILTSGSGMALSDTSSVAPRTGTWTPVIDVVAGDYFEAKLLTIGDSSVTVLAAYSWFAIEAVAVSATTGVSGTITLIDRRTITVASASEVFSSLGSYDDLIIVIDGRVSDAAAQFISAQCNADTTAGNYRYQRDGGSSTTTSAAQSVAANPGIAVGVLPGTGATANHAGKCEAVILSYRGTTFFKGGLAKAFYKTATADTDYAVQNIGSEWRSTAAITSVTLKPAAGNFVVGTTISIYGRGAVNTLLSGTAFPGSPTTNQRFFRTDRGIEYYWNGARWLSTEIYSIQLATQNANVPYTTNTSVYGTNPWSGLYDFYVERCTLAYYPTSTTATNYFVTQFNAVDGTTSTAIGGTISTQSVTINAWGSASVTPNTVISSAYDIFEFRSTETGTATVYLVGSVYGRLVG